MEPKQSSLRVLNWLTLTSVAVFIFGVVMNKYGLGSVELNEVIEKSLSEIENFFLALSFIGLLLNGLHIKATGGSFWGVFKLVTFWSFIFYLINLIFF